VAYDGEDFESTQELNTWRDIVKVYYTDPVSHTRGKNKISARLG
jgi:hypothetical protein